MRDWLDLIDRLMKLLLGKKQTIGLEFLQKIQELSEQIEKWQKSALPLLEMEVIPDITYSEAIQYFVKSRPNDRTIVRGAILREPHLKGQLFTQVFLDKNNDLVCGHDGRPYGRRLVIEKFDNELSDAFGEKNLIIVQ